MDKMKTNKSCQKCTHANVCYVFRGIVEMVELEQTFFENTKKAMPEILGAIGKNCRNFKATDNANL